MKEEQGLKAHHIGDDEKIFGAGLELDIRRFRVKAETEANKRK